MIECYLLSHQQVLYRCLDSTKLNLTLQCKSLCIWCHFKKDNNAIVSRLRPLRNMPICVLIVSVFYSAWNFTMNPQTVTGVCIKGISVFYQCGLGTICVMHRVLVKVYRFQGFIPTHLSQRSRVGLQGIPSPQPPQVISEHVNVREPWRWEVNKKCCLQLSWEPRIAFSLSVTLASVHWCFSAHT